MALAEVATYPTSFVGSAEMESLYFDDMILPVRQVNFELNLNKNVCALKSEYRCPELVTLVGLPDLIAKELDFVFERRCDRVFGSYMEC